MSQSQPQPRHMMSRVMGYNDEETGQPILRQYYCLCNSHCQEFDGSVVFQRLLRTLKEDKETGQPELRVIESFDDVVVRNCGDSEDVGLDFTPELMLFPKEEAEEEVD